MTKTVNDQIKSLIENWAVNFNVHKSYLEQFILEYNSLTPLAGTVVGADWIEELEMNLLGYELEGTELKKRTNFIKSILQHLPSKEEKVVEVKTPKIKGWTICPQCESDIYKDNKYCRNCGPIKRTQ